MQQNLEDYTQSGGPLVGAWGSKRSAAGLL